MPAKSPAWRCAMRHPDTPERIELVSGAPQVELALPQALAVTALRNLLDNALRHAPADHPVSLEIQSTQNSVTFRVCDSGPGLSTDELTQVTQRFWRRDTGRGSGLGLAIVVAITERCGGSLALAQRLTGGLEAKLTLPKARE